MKALVIGGSGVIGSAVARELAEAGWEVTTVGRTRGDLRCDIADESALKQLLSEVAPLDAVVAAVGSAVAGSALTVPPQTFADVLQDKLLNQIAVAQAAAAVLAPGGSITLTSGVLHSEPQPGLAAAGVANGAVAAFVRAAAIELGDTARINAVSPVFVIESAVAVGKTLPAHLPQMTARETAHAYRYAIESKVTGLDIDPRRIASSSGADLLSAEPAPHPHESR